MNLPTREQCNELMKEYHAPKNIIAHNEMTAKVAVFLAKKLRGKGVDVNIELVERAALLHDLLRICDFENFDRNHFGTLDIDISNDEYKALCKTKEKFKGKHHEEACFEVLKDRYPELALIVKKHQLVSILSKENKPRTWEEKLVFYADKRVKHDKIVSLKERFEDGRKRNFHLLGRDNSALAEELAFKLEKEIFDKIGMDPEPLNTG